MKSKFVEHVDGTICSAGPFWQGTDVSLLVDEVGDLAGARDSLCTSGSLVRSPYSAHLCIR